MVFLTVPLWIRSRLTDRFWRKQEVLRHARHFRGRKNRCYSLAVCAVRRAFSFRPWLTRVEAAALEHGVKYHVFRSGLYKCQLELNRKVLADLAIYEPKSFKSLAALAKRRGEEGLLAAQGGGKEPEGIFSRIVKCA
uniref:Large ribosomal subunit protein bL20m n=1 Tax=Salvator merianae TaxID=96440 RepID=A0A8D0DY57_SALMN